MKHFPIQILRPIRCVAFDAVGTLIYPEPSVSQIYWQAGQRHGSRLNIDQVRERFNRAFQQLAAGPRDDYSTSEIEERDRWRRIVESVLYDVTDREACFALLHSHFAMPAAWRAFDDVAETIARLVERGIQVIIASNFDERLHPICDGLPELRQLQRRVISACIGWHKPSQRFYQHLVESAECPAEQILMVGDDFSNDVQAARDCGLHAVWINRQAMSDGDSIQDLRELLAVV